MHNANEEISSELKMQNLDLSYVCMCIDTRKHIDICMQVHTGEGPRSTSLPLHLIYTKARP